MQFLATNQAIQQLAIGVNDTARGLPLILQGPCSSLPLVVTWWRLTHCVSSPNFPKQDSLE